MDSCQQTRRNFANNCSRPGGGGNSLSTSLLTATVQSHQLCLTACLVITTYEWLHNVQYSILGNTVVWKYRLQGYR
jgi:hypothetical protein